MDVISIASQKGGAGKTTLARNLAVAWGKGAGLLDLDPQGSLTDWWNARTADFPVMLQKSGSVTDTVERARGGLKALFIDTPPSVHAFLADVIHLSTLVVVPVRPTPDDLRAIGPTIDMIEKVGRPFVFVVTQAKPRTRLAADAVPALAQHGKVSPSIIYDRTDYPTAAVGGHGVTEHAPSSQAAEEVKALLSYVRKQLRK